MFMLTPEILYALPEGVRHALYDCATEVRETRHGNARLVIFTFTEANYRALVARLSDLKPSLERGDG